MPTALLETKLFVPRPRRGLVSRPRLSERLSQATTSKLILVSAPAGFGKTTLLAEWVAARSDADATNDRQVAWLSLDPRDTTRGVLAIRRRRAPNGRTRRWRECARASPADAAGTDGSRAHRAAQRSRRSSERHHSCRCSGRRIEGTSLEAESYFQRVLGVGFLMLDLATLGSAGIAARGMIARRRRSSVRRSGGRRASSP